MAQTRILVSSTCYDLSIVRTEIRQVIERLGHIPILSDYSDVLFDPSEHTHESCIREVKNCDIILFIIGARYGGSAIPSAINKLHIDQLINNSTKDNTTQVLKNCSITQLEVLMGFQLNKPIFTFILEGILHDHHVYTLNRGAEFISKISYPSIEKQETASYIFDYIDYIRKRTTNNAYFSFRSISDIETNFKKQLSHYLQRYIEDTSNEKNQNIQLDKIYESIEQLKSAFISVQAKGKQKDFAIKSMIWQGFLGFLSAFPSDKLKNAMIKGLTFEEFIFEGLGAKGVENKADGRQYKFIIDLGDSYYEFKSHLDNFWNKISEDWASFLLLNSEDRLTLFEAALELPEVFTSNRIKHFQKPLKLENVIQDIDDEGPPLL